MVEDCGEDKLAEEQSDVYVIAVNVCVRSLRGERVFSVRVVAGDWRFRVVRAGKARY